MGFLEDNDDLVNKDKVKAVIIPVLVERNVSSVTDTPTSGSIGGDKN